MNGLQPAGDDLRADLAEAYGVADSIGAVMLAAFVTFELTGDDLRIAATGAVALYTGWKDTRRPL